MVWFYGISTILGNLMPNLLYTEPKLIILHTVKCFQVLLYITNNLITYQSLIETQLNDQTVLFQPIQFSISHLLAHSLNVKQFFLLDL